ncbi:MAG: hypothetical protein H7A36_00475 [Chlamydiales bacterium]|nr:hypothetical protein [Chlamydiales bacterium]
MKKSSQPLLGEATTLEHYHEHVEDDQHPDIQFAMTKFFHEHFDYVTPMLPIFRGIFGLDISMQMNPFLRIARPNKGGDNIGFHRDTFYGGTPYELSFFVPLLT